MKTKCRSVAAIMLAFIWALLVVCSDDVLVYADWKMEAVGTFSSSILDSNDLKTESSTDFVLQDSQTIRTKMRNANHFSKMRLVHSVIDAKQYLLNLRQSKKYIAPWKIAEFSNEKVIIEYIHRQDGDKWLT